jgi:hypothetical protein
MDLDIRIRNEHRTPGTGPNLTAGEQFVLDQMLAFHQVAGADIQRILIGYQRIVAAFNTQTNSTLAQFDPGDVHDTHFHIDFNPRAAVASANAFGAAPLGSLTTGTNSTVAGFGSDPRLYYRFELGNGFQIAGRSNGEGRFTEVLSPNVDYTITIYKPSTNRWAVYHGRSNASGSITDIGSIILDQFGGPDFDGDGIPDAGEFAIGTSPNVRDTDGDGVPDDAEIAQGLDPLDGRAVPTGIISSLPLRGEAKEVVVEGSTLTPGGQTAYVATGSYGLAIVDASRFNNPIILGQLDLPGDATDVAVDSNLRIATVATNAGGLHFVDVSDPMAPTLLRTINVSASQVEVVQGVAYATVGGTLRAYDLVTGIELQALTLGGTLTGLVPEGSFLYTMNSSRVLRAIDISGFTMVARGSLTLPHGGGQVFVGNGIAYAAARTNPQGGYVTVNVSNPDTLTLISGPNVPGRTVIPGTAILPNGSGIGLLLGRGLVDLMDVSNPQDNFRRLVSIPLPAEPFSGAIGSGIAFVANGTAGLQVINYLPFDNRGQAPTVTASAIVTDFDPNTAGIQVLEGTSIPVRAVITDDVQVRNAELLVNGQVVRNDVSFPFDFVAIAPNVTPESSTFTIQVRATDTGGNTALSDVLIFDLVRDTVPPTIVGIEPPTNATQVEPLTAVRVRFSKSMAAATLNSATIRLRDTAGNFFTPTTFQLRNDDRFAQLTFAPLTLGSYEIVIAAAGITDRAGNPLGTTDIISPFSLTSRASLSTTAADDDPTTPGLQVFEGRTLPLVVNVVAGVAVQSVEFLVNGQVVGADTTAPFQFNVVAPNITPTTSSITLQARVTDTGGITTTTNSLVVGLLEDVTPPAVVSTDPPEGGRRFSGPQTVSVTFSEPLAPSSVTTANFQIFEAGPGGVFGDGNDVPVVITGIQLLNDDTVVQLTTDPVGAGDYQLQVHRDGITDRAGNPAGTGTFVSTFIVEQFLTTPDFYPFGTRLFLSDDQTTNIGPVPFAFQFFGQELTGNMHVSSNGNVQFEPNTLGATFNNFGLPSGNLILAAPYFDDVNPGAGGRVGFFDAGGVRAVTWEAVPYFGRSATVTFQIAFLSTGVVEVRYGAMASPPGGTADSGISAGTATIGLARGSASAVPSLGRIANRPSVAISNTSGIVTSTGLAALNELPGNDVLVFLPDGSGNYTILLNPTTGSGDMSPLKGEEVGAGASPLATANAKVLADAAAEQWRSTLGLVASVCR